MNYNNIWDEIKYKASLVVEMERHGISLKPSGRRFMCVCPFHSDSDPSMCVNVEVEVETYKCFGCGTSGSVIDFVKNYNHLNFSQTIKYFNEEYVLEYAEDVDVEKLLNNIGKKESRVDIYSYQMSISREVNYFLIENKDDIKKSLEILQPYLERIDEASEIKDYHFLDYESIKLKQHIDSIKKMKKTFDKTISNTI